MRVNRSLLLGCVLALAGGAVLAQAPAERIVKDAQGQVRAVPLTDDPALNNPWPAGWEAAFWERANHAIRAFNNTRLSPNTWGENEKDSYAKAMFSFIAGNRDAALRILQTEDSQPKDHAHTKGIDYYWCFTLKHQMRKYFFFGQYLDPAYKQRMFDGAKIWTEQNPLGRPHPAYGNGSHDPVGWGPDVKGGWVDARGTDNLQAMRETSVYLMAEETGNEQTRLLYKGKIRDYVWQLYNSGMAEWDSENYHGHTLAPYHNLYDFAKDPEVKALAKAALDWLYAAGAVKYWHGGFGGPNCRDYGNANTVFGANVSHPLALYFGDTVMPDPRPDRDDLYQITSAYRPPQAVVALARKEFARPVELFATKSPYRKVAAGTEVKPAFWETQYFGRSFQMGSLVTANPDDSRVWNVAPFKLMTANSDRGVDFVVANTVPVTEHSFFEKGNQIGQYRNLLIWLHPQGKGFQFLLPRTAKAEMEDGIWFARTGRTWLAVRPINLGMPEENPLDPGTEEKPNGKAEWYKDELLLHVPDGAQGAYAGFALEVGEEDTDGSYADFKEAVKAKGRLDVSKLAEGTVTFTGSTGRQLRLTYNTVNNLPIVERDGVQRAWDKELAVYQPVTGDGPIRQAFQGGTLTVQAGGHTFTSTVTKDGKATFTND